MTRGVASADRSIAVIGMACTFPGARNLTEFWRNIVNKTDSLTDVSEQRWDTTRLYRAAPENEDQIYCKRGGWIDGFAFNPVKYGIPPTAMEGVDPDQFLIIRTVTEALE